MVSSLTFIQVTSQDGFNNITDGSSEQFVAMAPPTDNSLS